MLKTEKCSPWPSETLHPCVNFCWTVHLWVGKYMGWFNDAWLSSTQQKRVHSVRRHVTSMLPMHRVATWTQKKGYHLHSFLALVLSSVAGIDVAFTMVKCFHCSGALCCTVTTCYVFVADRCSVSLIVITIHLPFPQIEWGSALT